MYLNRHKSLKSTFEEKTLQISSFKLVHYITSYKITVCLSHTGIMQQFTVAA